MRHRAALVFRHPPAPSLAVVASRLTPRGDGVWGLGAEQTPRRPRPEVKYKNISGSAAAAA